MHNIPEFVVVHRPLYHFCLFSLWHYNDIIMSAMASQFTSLTIVYSTVYSDANQRKHQSPATLAFVRGIHRWPVKSPHKGPVTRKMFPFHDVIMGYVKISFCCSAELKPMENGEWTLAVYNYRSCDWFTGVGGGISAQSVASMNSSHANRYRYFWIICQLSSVRFNPLFSIWCLFRHRPKETSKLRATGLCEGNSPVTGEFPAQRASNAENVSIWWRHHVA